MRHVGDLGNVHTDRFGHTKIRVNDRQVIIILIVVVIIIIVITIIIASMNSMMIINDEQALLEGPHTIIGRAIVIHTGEYRMLMSMLIKTGPAFETDQNETCDSVDDDQL